MDSVGMSCIKYLLFFFNLLFAISGIIIFTVGIIIQKMYYNYSQFIDDKFFSAPMVLIVVGVLVFVVAFFGCCGAIQESNFMLITFAILLFVIFLTEVAGGVAGYVMQKDIDLMLHQRMGKSMEEYGKNMEITNSWNVLQYDFKCCGTQSVTDWEKVYTNGTVPYSCCPDNPVDESCTPDKANNKGCLPVLKQLLEKNTALVGGFGLGVAFTQLIGVVFACFLARSIRKEYETV
ncbi:CD63 antigen-like [Macrosteles quadrilineatus]|uniref:CD63 antigen-like n=1 Tax=Macrosteles quadrilineatus TaxID=74068 RepID=UPI0023E22FCE|nr:CD63 antigen-like [Macrosteles quadrilineatus]